MSGTWSLVNQAGKRASDGKAEPDLKSEAEVSELTIRQMARLFEVSLRTLRYYEDFGLIAPRREGEARFYSGVERTRMKMILQGKQLGLSLTQISELIGGKQTTETLDLDRLQPDWMAVQIAHLERRRDEINGAIRNLRTTYKRLSRQAAD